MKLQTNHLRVYIRESLEHLRYDVLKQLADRAIEDMESGGRPEDIWEWLVAETDMGGGENRAIALVNLIKKKNPWVGIKLQNVGRDYKYWGRGSGA